MFQSQSNHIWDEGAKKFTYFTLIIFNKLYRQLKGIGALSLFIELSFDYLQDTVSDGYSPVYHIPI